MDASWGQYIVLYCSAKLAHLHGGVLNAFTTKVIVFLASLQKHESVSSAWVQYSWYWVVWDGRFVISSGYPRSTRCSMECWFVLGTSEVVSEPTSFGSPCVYHWYSYNCSCDCILTTTLSFCYCVIVLLNFALIGLYALGRFSMSSQQSCDTDKHCLEIYFKIIIISLRDASWHFYQGFHEFLGVAVTVMCNVLQCPNSGWGVNMFEKTNCRNGWVLCIGRDFCGMSNDLIRWCFL